MRIREIFLHNLRSFRGDNRISFVDELTDEARSLTVIAGTNGSGKTTIFEAVEGLLSFFLIGNVTGNPQTQKLTSEILAANGFISLRLEICLDDQSPTEQSSPEHIDLAIGHCDEVEKRWLDSTIPDQRLFHFFKPVGADSARQIAQDRLQTFRQRVQLMNHGEKALRDGLIYFPQGRHLWPQLQGGLIEPPAQSADWLFHFQNHNQWQGSLEAFWVWQNYLDLEQWAKGVLSRHLQPFVQTVEAALGQGRKITINEGRVMVPVAWHQNGDEAPKVRLDQLPSGEQHCLLLLGELARRRRSGAVILIDEPETSLHPTMQRLLMHQLRKLAREWDSQLILATHSLEILRAAHHSQRIILDHLDAAEGRAEDAA
jgi:predicted ATPase